MLQSFHFQMFTMSQVDTFFAVGSPLGVFLSIRNVRIGIGKSQQMAFLCSVCPLSVFVSAKMSLCFFHQSHVPSSINWWYICSLMLYIFSCFHFVFFFSIFSIVTFMNVGNVHVALFWYHNDTWFLPFLIDYWAMENNLSWNSYIFSICWEAVKFNLSLGA